MITRAYPVHPTKGYDMDLAAPVVVCDHCHKIISADDPGNILWYGDEPRRVWHDHKRCDWTFEKLLTDAYPDRYTDSWDLDGWIAQLAHNYADPLTRPRSLDFEDGLGGVETFHITRWRPRLGRVE